MKMDFALITYGRYAIKKPNYTFPTVNVIVQLEIELAYYETAVQLVANTPWGLHEQIENKCQFPFRWSKYVMTQQT